MPKLPDIPVILHFHAWIPKILRHDDFAPGKHVYLRYGIITAKVYAHIQMHQDQRKRWRLHHFWCRYVRQLIRYGYAKMPIEIEAETYAVNYATSYEDVVCPRCENSGEPCSRLERFMAWFERC